MSVWSIRTLFIRKVEMDPAIELHDGKMALSIPDENEAYFRSSVSLTSWTRGPELYSLSSPDLKGIL